MSRTILQDYRALVAAIGPGFHPDTSAAEYLFLPQGYTPRRVDGIVALASQVCDPYAVALEVLERGQLLAAGWSQDEADTHLSGACDALRCLAPVHQHG